MKTLKLTIGFLLVSSLAFADSGQLGGGGGGGGGNVIGPVVGTDNAIARFNGDGTHLKNSAVFIGDDRSIGGLSTVNMDSLITFDGIGGGAAITAGSYQIGRDADATNQIHFNVPTGSSFEFSINDVSKVKIATGIATFDPAILFNDTSHILPVDGFVFGVDSSGKLRTNVPTGEDMRYSVNGADQLVLDATSADFKDNSFKTTGKIAIGDGAVIANDRYVDFSRTITTFPTGNEYVTYSNTILDPSTTVGTGSESIVVNENTVGIPSGNSENFNLENFSNAEFFFRHAGSGDVSSYIALWGGATNDGSGDITFEQVAGYFTAYNNGSGNIPGTVAKAGNFAVAAGTGNFSSGSIARDYVYYAESPFLTGGSIDKHWGLYFEDQQFGTESWAIQTDGGRVEFGSPSGKDQLLFLTDDDVTQQYTSFPGNSFLHIAPVSSTIGGATISALTDGDAPAFNVRGVLGTASPSNTSATFRFTGAKSNGAGGVQDVGTGDLLFEFVNNSLTSQPAFMCRGNRTCAMSGVFPAARLDINSNGEDSSSQSFQVTSSGSGTSRFRVRNDDHVTIGNPTGGQNAFLNVNGANAAGGSAEGITINSTLAAMNGSDSYRGLLIDVGNANHTGASNTVRGIYIDGITFDADADATAIELGSGGWNYAMKMPTGVGLQFGAIDVTDSTGLLSIGAPLLVGGGADSVFNSPIAVTIGSGFGKVSASGSTGGCLMIRDTDNGGWTQCDALDGTLSCSADDGDGECD